MPATPITDPVTGESLVGTEPRLQQQVDPGWWRQRLNLYTGRQLTVDALTSEQEYRGGLLATLGQALTAGTVTGLALTMDTSGPDPTFSVSPGFGIMANGQDVALHITLKTRLSTLTVVDAFTGLDRYTFHQSVGDPTNSTYAGILLLQPVIAQVSGQELDTGSLPAIVSGNLGASCTQDPEEYAFEDWQIADAVRLVYLPWPSGVPNVTNLQLPPVEPQATWRNRLAYTIFEAEALLGEDDQLPWATLGLPVALIGFDPGVGWKAKTAYTAGQYITDPNGNVQTVKTKGGTSDAKQPANWSADWGGLTKDGSVTWVNSGLAWKPLFVDCNAVVRAGGLPRNRYVLLSQPPALRQTQTVFAQARINQFSEQLSQVMAAHQQFKTLADIFPTLPPAGILPVDALNFTNQTAPWFPPNWTITAAPVFLEELETVLETGMMMDPIAALPAAPENSDDLEPVEVLVPLPDAVYDPNILVVDTVPRAFYQELAQATQARNFALQQLQTVQQELNNLYTGIGPNVPSNPNLIDPNAGLTADELASRATPPPYTPSSTETFGTVLRSTWESSSKYTAAQFVIDSNGAIQVAQSSGTTAALAPDWNESSGATTIDASITWLNNGPWAWQPNTSYVLGQFVVDPQGFRQTVTTAGISASAPPVWIPPKPPGTTTTDGNVTWKAAGKSFWQPKAKHAAGDMILDANGNIQVVETAGTSGTAVPYWDSNLQQLTKDTIVVWKHLGHATWQAGTDYSVGQAILDSTGSIQVVTSAGKSAVSAPNWLVTESQGQTTPDGIVWQSGGNANWQPNYLYAAGQLILDAKGNIQIVQTGGISGDSVPSWNPNAGQTTQHSGIVWTNLGHSKWQANTRYSSRQAILDANGNIQVASIGGTSGANQPTWSEGGSATTRDSSVTWTNEGLITWQKGTTYTAGQIVIDANNNLQCATILDANGNSQPIGTGGTSGSVTPAWSTTPGRTTTDGNITWEYLAYSSTELMQIQTTAALPPYTTTFTDSKGAKITIALLSQADLNNLQTNGLQALITALNVRISRANDLLDTAFLTAQTDIYRYRQHVLGATDAAALATSPVLANIATGGTASATAENLQNYISSLLPSKTTVTASTASGSTTTTTTTGPPVFHKPVFGVLKEPLLAANPAVLRASSFSLAPRTQSIRGQAVTAALAEVKSAALTIHLPGGTSRMLTGASQTAIEQALSGVSAGTAAFKAPALLPSGVEIGLLKASAAARPTQIIVPGQNVAATPADITGQSALPGAQLNIRTLTIAERLAQSPSQEAMFYSISNRLNFLQTLQTLETDLDLVAADLPILVDGQPTTASGNTATPVGVPVETHTFSEWLDPTIQPTILQKIQNPYLVTDSAEATLFSVGVRVVEQHTMLLRALEGRVQQYSDFVTLCTNALQNMQNDIQQGKAYVTQLTNKLLQARQDVAFTNALLQDEIQRVQNTNAQRRQVLASSVQLIAYTRARTLEATDTAPSRQLVPATVSSAVPACLQQSVASPPELREIIGQLREAPVSWLPFVNFQVSNLERPVLLQQLAMNTQARAAQLLQMPQLPSSAAGEVRAYAPTIAHIHSANQQIFRNFSVQRAAIRPAVLTSMSWIQQVGSLQNVAAVNDLISAEPVNTEVSNAVARLIQQISSVATCLYTRASIEQPIDRLTWANYLTGAGLSVQLQSLAILPGWNQLGYTDRQQMQMLVDWLFLQIDTANSGATAFMSDLVRTAILLASDVPVDNIIPGNIVARVQPAVGNTVRVSLPSDRIASGMYVNLYSGATLAARAVVSDLDTSTVHTTVTDVFTPGAYLETTDTAHFTTLAPQAVALRPLFMQS